MDQDSGLTPLQELNSIEAELDRATQFYQLEPLYERVERIGRSHAEDFEVQLAVTDLKQHLFEKGRKLRNGNQRRAAADRVNVPAPVPAGAIPPQSLTRKSITIGITIGVLGSLVLWVSLVQLARRSNREPSAPSGTVAVEITTTPPGAAIQINNEPRCTSNCKLNLPPGNYQVTALLDGFDPVATGMTVVPGAPVSVNLPLQAQAQAVRILTDLDYGRVILDRKPAGELQDGQLTLDRVPNGKHTVLIIGRNGEAQFQFESAGGKAPQVVGPISARNLFTAVVGSVGNQAFVQTNSPQKVALDAQPQGDTGQAPLELKNITPGNHDLTVGEGPDQKKVVVTIGPAPVLTAFVKSDVNSGTLVVVAGENDAAVFVDGKEQKRKTQRGQLRVPVLGEVTVRVAKEGFQPAPELKIAVAKGEEKRLEFKLVPLPQVASLQVRGAAPGTSVFLGERNLGAVGPDGTLSAANLVPGDHLVELRRQGFANRRLLKAFRPGETVILTGPDVAMVATTGMVHLGVNPPETQVTYKHADESQTHPAQGTTLKLDAGSYIFTARAPGYTDRTERLTLGAGETRTVDLMLQKQAAAAQPKPPAPAGPDWSRAGWTLEDGVWVRKGGNFVPVRSGPIAGTVTFTAGLRRGGGFLRGGGKIRWVVDYQDAKNYCLFEFDKKNFVIKEVRDGRSMERDRTQHNLGDLKNVQIQVDVAKDRVVNKMRLGQQWVVLDSWSQPGRDFTAGRFGFLVPGNDEIGVSDFRFSPR